MLYRRLPVQVAVPLCLLAVFMTIMTKSATSIVMLLTGVGVVASFHLSWRLRLGGDLAAVLIVLGLVGLGSVTLMKWEGTTSLLDKDVTASGRTEAWDDAIHIIAYRPLSGFGLGVVWGLGRRTYFPQFHSTRSLSHAHNGYLNLAAQAGLPAVALTLVYLIRALVRAIADFSVWRSAFALFSVAYSFMFLIGNLAEFSDLHGRALRLAADGHPVRGARMRPDK